MQVPRDRGRRERGQALIMFVMGIVAFVGFVALTIDAGLIFEGRRGEQNAADAAALAGASALPATRARPSNWLSTGAEKRLRQQ